MRKRVICVLAVMVAIGAVWAAVAVAGAEKPVVVRAENVILTVNGNASPKALPRHKLAPVSFHASGRIASAGRRPSTGAARSRARYRQGRHDRSRRVPGLQAPAKSKRGRLEEAERSAADAIVGRGRTEVEVEFPESSPFTAKGPLVIFNGGRKGGQVPALHPRLRQRAGADGGRHAGGDDEDPPRRLQAALGRDDSGGRRRRRLGDRLLSEHRPQGLPHGQLRQRAFLRLPEANFAEELGLEGSFERPCTPID